jgi:hypothetical protein
MVCDRIPAIFDDQLVVHMHLNMTSDDWSTIVNDATFTIYKPAMLWGEALGETEAPLLVSIRRKSSIPICNAAGKSCKVSFKISVDEFKDIYDAGCALAGTAPASCEDMPALQGRPRLGQPQGQVRRQHTEALVLLQPNAGKPGRHRLHQCRPLIAPSHHRPGDHRAPSPARRLCGGGCNRCGMATTG